MSVPELAEVFAINSIAPTVINSKLKPLLENRKHIESTSNPFDRDGWKFVVNVSAMEGKFYRYKSDKHPHTNMAKVNIFHIPIYLD